ncbi:MAG: hypothetical protein ACJAT3_000273 [Akkermansiaceae bacterium]|jgi:hypothetical protein
MLPDAWELTYFPSLATQGGDADFDADGLTNYEEFLYDTLSSTIRFLITVSPDSWTNTQNGQRAGTDALMSETFSVAGSPKRSFRLIVESP